MTAVCGPSVVCIENGSFVENTWLVIDDATLEAVVIDPGEEHARILGEIARRDLTVTAIWLTHAHIDHIWGVDAVRAATGAPVWLHPADRRWYDSLPEQGKMFGIDNLPRLAAPDHSFSDGDSVSLGAYRFDVRHAPGHAPGHVAFIGHGLAIAGDVLFEDSIGRTDLAGGDHAQLLESIHRVLLVLPDETRVLPGHGPETTVGRERRLNPFLRAA
ncbi:MAG: MBL fold metallo-hydrolase [Gemmatimonadales bacterium]|nr:MBL fold metallo-hydrolase [Gemmatimonadales bacterium]